MSSDEHLFDPAPFVKPAAKPRRRPPKPRPNQPPIRSEGERIVLTSSPAPISSRGREVPLDMKRRARGATADKELPPRSSRRLRNQEPEPVRVGRGKVPLTRRGARRSH